jgi:hypothetical protein
MQSWGGLFGLGFLSLSRQPQRSEPVSIFKKGPLTSFYLGSGRRCICFPKQLAGLALSRAYNFTLKRIGHS